MALGYFQWRENPKPVQEPPRENSKPKAEIPKSESGHKDSEPETAANAVCSPFAGTFHRKPAPDKAPWVADGAGCAAGATICAIEAMKLLNTIAAPRDCKAVHFLVADGATVAKGTPLFTAD